MESFKSWSVSTKTTKSESFIQQINNAFVFERTPMLHEFPII